MVFREVNEQNRTPEASAFFASKNAGNTRQNRRKPSQKSVDVSGVQNRSFTSRKSIHLCFQHPQKMRAPTAPSFTKFNSARLTRTAESLQNPGAPAGRVLAQNEFPSKQWARSRRAHSLYFISPPDPNGRIVTEPRGRAQGLASQFRTVLTHDGGATGASCSCGTHIEQRSGASLRGGQVDVAEMRHAVCSLLEVLSGDNSSCSCDLLAMAVEPQPSFY